MRGVTDKQKKKPQPLSFEARVGLGVRVSAKASKRDARLEPQPGFTKLNPTLTWLTWPNLAPTALLNGALVMYLVYSQNPAGSRVSYSSHHISFISDPFPFVLVSFLSSPSPLRRWSHRSPPA